MSPGKYFKNKWVDLFVGALISASMVLIGFWLTSSDMDAREFKKELDSKATKIELKEAIKAHEEKEEARDEAVEKMFNKIIENQDKISIQYHNRITWLERNAKIK
jgi:uncharacterized membrane protein YgaE (UPF0421/DUF939 family)